MTIHVTHCTLAKNKSRIKRISLITLYISIKETREMTSVAAQVSLLLTLFAIVIANIEIDVTDSVANNLEVADHGENR